MTSHSIGARRLLAAPQQWNVPSRERRTGILQLNRRRRNALASYAVP